jgi:hypothetical protein
MMQKLENLGCAKPVVGLVLPAGYTFNADGTCIYLTLATVFVAQATNTHLSIIDQLVILGVLLLTSKGSAGVAGAGFITLAATLSTLHAIPVSGLVLLLGVDRFLNEARAVTNLIGNSVATVAIAKWDGALDMDQARATLPKARQAHAFPVRAYPVRRSADSVRRSHKALRAALLASAAMALPSIGRADGLLFHLTGDKGLKADVAAGEATPNFADKVKIKTDPDPRRLYRGLQRAGAELDGPRQHLRPARHAQLLLAGPRAGRDHAVPAVPRGLCRPHQLGHGLAAHRLERQGLRRLRHRQQPGPGAGLDHSGSRPSPISGC